MGGREPDRGDEGTGGALKPGAHGRGVPVDRQGDRGVGRPPTGWPRPLLPDNRDHQPGRRGQGDQGAGRHRPPVGHRGPPAGPRSGERVRCGRGPGG